MKDILLFLVIYFGIIFLVLRLFSFCKWEDEKFEDEL